MSTGYGFEIAIRDIAAGEEITDEYSMFNFPSKMELKCEKTPCREIISDHDLKMYHKAWDVMIKSALKNFLSVDQPLEPFLNRKTKEELEVYLQTGKNYISVIELEYSTIE